MTDSHIHIGQFYDTYYDPAEIIRIVMESGAEGLVFSSTTSCKDDVTYTEVEKEIAGLFSRIPWSAEMVKPYLWYIPSYSAQGVTPETAIANLPYKGIKLHPLANHWDLEDTETVSILHGLFDYARRHTLPVLMHTGHSGVDAADTFSAFFSEYPEVHITLAHCRPLDQTIDMMQKHKNIYCDTAFVEEEAIRRIIGAGFAPRIVLGSDFPITHYFRTKYPPEGENPAMSLEEKYREDINK
ncbi:MAG: amidohydrolase family protein, partial [Treponema sp.]|nr:amidohydrolase family protein [Treponema sp.]